MPSHMDDSGVWLPLLRHPQLLPAVLTAKDGVREDGLLVLLKVVAISID